MHTWHDVFQSRVAAKPISKQSCHKNTTGLFSLFVTKIEQKIRSILYATKSLGKSQGNAIQNTTGRFDIS